MGYDTEPFSILPLEESLPTGHEEDNDTSNYDTEEQQMFEQQLCEDPLGVQVRKINHSGKSQLRYVRCVPLTPGMLSGTASVTSAKSKSSLGSLKKVFFPNRKS